MPRDCYNRVFLHCEFLRPARRREVGRIEMKFVGMWLAMLCLCAGTAGPVFAEPGTPHNEPTGRDLTSIQALTSVGNDLVYAGSFGHGLFRSEDRGATWARSGQGVTDPFILTLTTGKDGVIYAGTFQIGRAHV